MKRCFIAAIAVLIFAPPASAQIITHSVDAELVKSFPSPNQPDEIIPIDNNKFLLFVATSTAQNDFQLWSSDGTSANTFMISDTFANHCLQRGHLGFEGYATLNGSTYLTPPVKTGAINSESEPWVSDGTVAGTYQLADLYPNGSTPSSSTPFHYMLFDNKVFFTANTPGGTRVFTHVGTSAPVVFSGIVTYFYATVAGNRMFLSGHNGSSTTNKGLYKITAGANTAEFVAPFENIVDLTALGNNVIFWGKKPFPDNTGMELYFSDGTGPGTILLKDLVSGSLGPTQPVGLPSRIRTDGRDRSFVVLNGFAYFAFQDPNDQKNYLYKTDGTVAGTVPFYSTINSLRTPFRVGNYLIFRESGTGSGVKTLTTDGISAPTPLVVGGSTSIQFDPVYDGDYTYDGNGHIMVKDGWGTGRFVITDGTSSGTKRVKVNNLSHVLKDLNDFTLRGNYVYFYGGNYLYRFNPSAITTSVDQLDAESSTFNVYPNPVVDKEIFIEFGKVNGNCNVKLFGMNGSLISEANSTIRNGKVKADVAPLAPGTYLLQCIVNNDVYRKVLIVQSL